MNATEERIAADRTALPFGDPCPRCGAASTHADPRDRMCGCEACPACGAPGGSICAYCSRLLGCNAHSITIDQHVSRGLCLATAEQRAELDVLFSEKGGYENSRPMVEAIRGAAPKPWAAP